MQQMDPFGKIVARSNIIYVQNNGALSNQRKRIRWSEDVTRVSKHVAI